MSKFPIKLVGVLVSGQSCCLDLAKEGSILLSLYTRDIKLEHLACPMVCPPENKVNACSQFKALYYKTSSAKNMILAGDYNYYS